MKKSLSSTKHPNNLVTLREKAEVKLRTQIERLQLQKFSSEDIRDLVHELGTHQIELEMQNEELRGAQEELEASRSRYADLYDLAPVGYLTFDTRGLIREVNLTGANLLGIPRNHLINVFFTPFLAEAGDLKTFRAFCRKLFTTGARQSCELSLKKKDNTAFHAQLQGLATENIDDKAGLIRVAVIDITERKLAEEERDRINREHLGALSKIKTLAGLLPICMHCKKIRDDDGYWNQLEAYVSAHSEAEFSHGICPECAKELYPNYFKNKNGA